MIKATKLFSLDTSTILPIKEEFKSGLKIQLPEKVVAAKNIQRRTKGYRVGSIIILGSIDGCDIPIFGKLETIAKFGGNWFLCCKILFTNCFNDHFHAYEVQETEDWHILPVHQVTQQCLDMYKVEDTTMVTLQYEV